MSKFKFGEKLLSIHASERNPHRVGMFVRSYTRTGRLNPGQFVELTDGKGDFWDTWEKNVIPFVEPLYAPPESEHTDG